MHSSASTETTSQPEATPRGRGCRFYFSRGLKWFGITLIILVVLGVGYQTVATEIDKRTYLPHGQLYTVNGQQMHMVCMGEGSPVVVLQAGGLANSTWWYWVQNQLAKHTRVCAFDRPGFGWSKPVEGSRDALAIDAELHALLRQAGISAPYVMAGHSLGALWTRVYAGKYRHDIAGVVFVDSAAVPVADPFETQSEFDAWAKPRIVLQIPVWLLYRLGIDRLIGSSLFLSAGYPADLASEMAALQAPNSVFDASYAEQIPGMEKTINAAAAIKDLGNLPVMVLWAGNGALVVEQARPIRDEIASLSTNEAVRYVDGADHLSILGNEQYAQQVTDAILDVIDAVTTGEPLTQ